MIKIGYLGSGDSILELLEETQPTNIGLLGGSVTRCPSVKSYHLNTFEVKCPFDLEWTVWREEDRWEVNMDNTTLNTDGSLSLDDFSQKQNLAPTHLKIDVDGAESKVLKGSTQILKSKTLKEIYIEIPESQIHLIKYIESFGFKVKWERTEGKFKEMIFLKSLQ